MKLLVRGLAALALLVVIGVVALALLLPRYAASDAVREQIRADARRTLGREIRYAALEVGVLPPSLKVMETVVDGDAPEDEPLLEAEVIALRLSLIPLLFGTIVVDSLVVDGAKLRMVRTPQGLALPRAGAAAQAGEAPAPGAEQGAAGGLAVREVSLRNTSVVLLDRAVSPPVTWELRQLDARAAGTSLDEPLAFDVSFELASGGSLRARGTAQTGGAVDVEVTLDDVALAPVQPYLDPGTQLAGRLSGTVAAQGPAASPTAFRVDVVARDADVKLDDVHLRGRVALTADLSGGLEALRGPFDVNATDAELRYADAFTKPRGERGQVKGQLVRRPDGTTGVDYELVVHNLEGKGDAELGKRTRAKLTAPPFDLAGWGELIPAIAGLGAEGRIGFEGLAVATAPLDVRGTVRLDGVSLRAGARTRVTLSGGLEGEGSAMHSRDLALELAGQRISVEASVSGLNASPAFSLAAEARDLDTNALVTAVAGKADFMYGPLSFRGDARGPLGGNASPLDALTGRLRFDAGPGRLRDVSLLKLTLDRLGAIGGAAALTGAIFGGVDLESFYDDAYQSLSGTLDVAGGAARTSDLRLVHRSYTVELAGALGLADLSLDMTGRIVLGERLLAALPGRWSEGLGGTIPLAHVGGTLDQPQVKVASSVAPTLLRGFGAARALEKPLDKALGEGVGGAVGGILDGVLRGGAPKRE